MFFQKSKEIERLKLENSVLRSRITLLTNTPPVIRESVEIVPIGAKAIIFPDEPEEIWKDRLIHILAGSMEPAITFDEFIQRSTGLKEVTGRVEVAIRRGTKCNT